MGTGPAPKAPEQRRNRHKPLRGEWVTIPEPTTPPPKLPRGMPWTPRTKAAWDSWWRDPASTQWTEADKGAVVELAYVHHELAMGKLSAAAEVRLRMDLLGLTQKGKRDLRWRVGEALPEIEQPAGVTELASYRGAV